MKVVILLAILIIGVSCFPEKRSLNGCNSFCPMYIIEFCGSDGKTYNSNECFLKSQWCNEGRNDFESFSTLHMGACTGQELLEKTTTSA
ncbi:turripeptide Ici9.2-like [Ruditapes philippinarum]|uniref:turripeptide Ici9.2-like n=1 Tax=Ruditapes philippinarum TaxID=129788 RepID=UPI00295B79EB|nr:turripeptide Ici9.2-like [Ruditapes philippinarum]